MKQQQISQLIDLWMYTDDPKESARLKALIIKLQDEVLEDIVHNFKQEK